MTRVHHLPFAPGGWTCREVRARIDELLSRDLTPAARKRVMTHLTGCRHCYSRVAFARMLRRITREQFPITPTPRRVAATIRRRIG